MNRIQSAIILCGIVIIVLMSIFPPWNAKLHNGGRHTEKPIGYSFIANPPAKFQDFGSAWGTKIDMPRLFVQCIAVTGITLGLVLACKMAENKR